MDFGPVTNAAFAGVAVLGIALAVIAFRAVRRRPSPRMGAVAAGFALLATQGLVIGAALAVGDTDLSFLLFLSAMFEAAVLVALFLATVLR